jgi:hypothetical protein
MAFNLMDLFQGSSGSGMAGGGSPLEMFLKQILDQYRGMPASSTPSAITGGLGPLTKMPGPIATDPNSAGGPLKWNSPAPTPGPVPTGGGAPPPWGVLPITGDHFKHGGGNGWGNGGGGHHGGGGNGRPQWSGGF